MRYPARTVPPRRAWLSMVALLVAPLFVVTACGGSAIDPSAAQAANERIRGQGGQNGVPTGVTNPTGLNGTGSDLPGGSPTDPGNQPPQPGAPISNPQPGSPSGPSGGGGIAARPASCDGFRNQKGITDSTITIGNAADISGPLPGLFTSAQLATRAYVEYFNATSNVCGRKLALKTYDTRTDAGANQTAYARMCDETFAAIGSMSVFDSGGAKTAQDCGLPDILSSAITPERNACTTCFGIQTSGQGEFNNATYDFWLKRNRAATQKAAFLYLNAGAAATNAKVQIAVAKQRGFHFEYTSPIDVADFNYGPYVQQMKSKGVQFVQFIGGYQQGIRLLQAMQAASFSPPVKFFDQSIYDQGFLKTGGSAVNGVSLYITFAPFEEHQSELDLYKQWLNQVSPGATPAFAGLFAWSAAKLFVQEALQLGGKLNRSSLVAKTASVSNWTGGGMHAPMSVGSKHTAACVRFMSVASGRFVTYGPTKYQCNGISRG